MSGPSVTVPRVERSLTERREVGNRCAFETGNVMMPETFVNLRVGVTLADGRPLSGPLLDITLPSMLWTRENARRFAVYAEELFLLYEKTDWTQPGGGQP